jgi:hypothetical protein
MFGRLKAYSQKEWAFCFSMIYGHETRTRLRAEALQRAGTVTILIGADSRKIER